MWWYMIVGHEPPLQRDTQSCLPEIFFTMHVTHTLT